MLLVGRLSYADFQSLTRDLAGVEIAAVIAHEKYIGSDWDSGRTGLLTWTRKDFVRPRRDTPHTAFHDQYSRILSTMLADVRSLLLLERIYGTGGARSVFNHTIRMEQAIWNSLSLLGECKPDRIVSTNTPHDVTWFFARTAELLGIPFLLTATSPLPWRTWVTQGVDGQVPQEIASDDRTSGTQPSKKVADFVAQGLSSYSAAIPTYEKARLTRYRGRYFSLRIELLNILRTRSPRTTLARIYSAVKKRSLLNTYQRYASAYVRPPKYVVFFLHFQPERTTLPDGYAFTQQWFAVRTMAAALPEGWTLVIKEHPSIFRTVFSPTVRTPEFYRSIHALPNARLAPLELTPFDLIDHSSAVATITGTVGIESLIRGKPVLVFGAAQYRRAKGVFSVSSTQQVAEAIRCIDAGGAAPSRQELLDYFSWVEQNSFPKEERINGSVAALRGALLCAV